jgi:hypothetical protein
MTVICPTCGKEAKEVRTRYGLRHSCCGLWSWGGAPLVDGATHEARKRAHEAIDPIWKSGEMSRDEVYRRLGGLMGMSREECHIKLMGVEEAERVVRLVERVREG